MRNPPFFCRIAALLTGAALLAGAIQSRAQATDYLNSFDDESSVASWIYWYGLGFDNTPMTWDPAMDAQTNSSSGSLAVSLPFGATGDQAVFFGTFGNNGPYDGSVILNGTQFTNVTVDVRVAPGTPLSPAGDFGTLQIGLVRSNWVGGGTFYFNGQTIPASAGNGWVRLVQPIDQTSSGLDAVAGINFKYTSYSGYPTSPFSMWLDNVEVVAKTLPTPPPTLSAPTRPVPGLNLFSSGANGGEFQRVNVRLVNTTGNGWWDSPTPVTYSISITNTPGAAFPGFQTHLFLVTGNPPAFETSPDYNQTNLIFLDIQTTADGPTSGIGSFRYKINQPNSNANLYGPDNGTAGTLASLFAPSLLGTWSLTFDQNTNVTLTGPDGSTTNFTLSAVAASQFVDPLNVYVGCQPNSVAAIGRNVVLSRFGITGNASPVNDDFTQDSVLDTDVWQPIAGDVNTVQLVPQDTVWWASWSLPDTGFSLQTTTNLTDSASWTLLSGPNAPVVEPFPSFTAGGKRLILLPSSSLTSTNIGYFRLIQDH